MTIRSAANALLPICTCAHPSYFAHLIHFRFYPISPLGGRRAILRCLTGVTMFTRQQSSNQINTEVEQLESRRLLSSVLLSSGVLTVVGSQGNDQITVSLKAGSTTQLSVDMNGTVKSFTVSAINSIVIGGRLGNDLIQVSNVNGVVPFGVFVKGGSDKDTLIGGNFNDTLYGGDHNDVIEGSKGNDSLFGDEANDDISGGAGNDVIYGGAGNDSLLGDDGNDLLVGGPNDDDLDGGAGTDSLYGQLGNDDFFGDPNEVKDLASTDNGANTLG